jgi:hypothetical protein
MEVYCHDELLDVLIKERIFLELDTDNVISVFISSICRCVPWTKHCYYVFYFSTILTKGANLKARDHGLHVIVQHILQPFC